MDNLAVQSWCFRKYKDAAEIIDALGKCKLSHLEICPVHIDVANPLPTLKRYADAGITISSFGVFGLGHDDRSNAQAFELAAAARLSAFSADISDLEALGKIEKLCEQYHIKVAVHNHGRKHQWGSVRALEQLFTASSPNIGLCLDTAWMLDSGENPVAVAGKFRNRLYGLHLKDFVFDRAGHGEDVVVGSGNLDLPALAALLREISFAGYRTVEYEADPENPVPAIADCVKAIREALK